MAHLAQNTILIYFTFVHIVPLLVYTRSVNTLCVVGLSSLRPLDSVAVVNISSPCLRTPIRRNSAGLGTLSQVRLYTEPTTVSAGLVLQLVLGPPIIPDHSTASSPRNHKASYSSPGVLARVSCFMPQEFQQDLVCRCIVDTHHSLQCSNGATPRHNPRTHCAYVSVPHTHTHTHMHPGMDCVPSRNKAGQGRGRLVERPAVSNCR